MNALLTLVLCAGLIAVAMPCTAFCGESSEPENVVEADAPSHCGRAAPSRNAASSDTPVECCSEDCDACGIDRVSVPAPTAVLQLVVPHHAPMLVSIDWRAELDARLVRIRARSPDEARPHLLDVLSRTTTLLI